MTSKAPAVMDQEALLYLQPPRTKRGGKEFTKFQAVCQRGMPTSIEQLFTKDKRIASGTYRLIQVSTQERFQLAFLLKNPAGEIESIQDVRNLHQLSDSTSRRKPWRLTLFVFGPDGEPVRNAGVVFSVICPHNVHKMGTGTPGQIGYHFEYEAARDGVFRMEAEISIRGQLLVDGFSFEILRGRYRRSS